MEPPREGGEREDERENRRKRTALPDLSGHVDVGGFFNYQLR